MSRLRELQIRFATALVDGARHVQADARPAVGLQVYRNNLQISLTETLARAYPVIMALGGEPFFRAIARRYLTEHLPSDGALRSFGAEFASFLSGLGQLRAYPYFADVARLEWARQEVLLAPAGGVLDVQRLAGIDVEQYESLCFRANSSVRLIMSSFPVLSIWKAHQGEDGSFPTVDLQAGGQNVLVWRRAGEVVMRELNNVESVLLDGFCHGLSLGDMLFDVGRAYSMDQLLVALASLFKQKLIADFEVAEKELA